MTFDPTVSIGGLFEIAVFILGLAVTWGSLKTKLDDHGRQLTELTSIDKTVAVHETRITEHDRRLDKVEAWRPYMRDHDENAGS